MKSKKRKHLERQAELLDEVPCGEVIQRTRYQGLISSEITSVASTCPLLLKARRAKKKLECLK